MKSRPGASIKKYILLVTELVLYPEEYRRRVDEAMRLYDCDHSDAEGIVEAEYLDKQLNT
jgi:hypothetical protein